MPMPFSLFAAFPATPVLAQADPAAPASTPAPAPASAPAPAVLTDDAPAPVADAPVATQGTDGLPLGTPGAPGAAPRQADPFGGSLFIIMIVLLGAMILFSILGGRREKARKAQLLESLTKGARVQTSGGIRGTVVEVRDEEVVVKVDENSNTRLRFDKASVVSVAQ